MVLAWQVLCFLSILLDPAGLDGLEGDINKGFALLWLTEGSIDK